VLAAGTPFPIGAAIAALAAALGVVAAIDPLVSLAATGVAAYVACALWRRRWLVVIAVLLLGVDFSTVTTGTLAAGGTYKAAIYALLVPMAIHRGLDLRKAAVLLAYPFVAVLSEAFGTRIPGLTLGDSVSSFLTLGIGWFAFAIRWRWDVDSYVLKVLAVVPATSVLIGIGLDLAGRYDFVSQGVAPRLQGATIPAYLAALAFAAVVASRTLHERSRWRPATVVGWFIVAIVGASVSRGAIIAVVIVGLPIAYAYAARRVAERGLRGLFGLVTAGMAVLLLAAAFAPSVIERDTKATVYTATGGLQNSITSGRASSWSYVYSVAEVNLAFGRGLGAGPLVGASPSNTQGFLAQHNEYLRMLLEGGFIGGFVVLSSAIFATTSAVRRVPSGRQATLWAYLVGCAVYSFTDNTLSAPELAVSLLLTLGLATAPSAWESVRARTADAALV